LIEAFNTAVIETFSFSLFGLLRCGRFAGGGFELFWRVDAELECELCRVECFAFGSVKGFDQDVDLLPKQSVFSFELSILRLLLREPLFERFDAIK